MSQLHDSLKFYISPDKYSLVAEAEKGETLEIDRHSNSISLVPSGNRPINFDREVPVYGLFGIVSLLESDYVILITKRSKVAKIFGTTIYSATDFAVFPIDRRSQTQLLAQPDEAYLLGLVKAHLYSAPFYFTYGGYNVCTRLQAQAAPGEKQKPFWQQADDRFFWNRHLQGRLADAPSGEFARFILPVMFGFLNIKSATLNGRDLIFGLISRRNRKRAGTRYFSRGIDQEGNVSNFNETEQLLLLDSDPNAHGPVRGEIKYSYVQTRGSVPVYWAEINNLRYKPDLRILDLDRTAESVDKHFEQQVNIYGDQYLVNLVNQKGYEQPVKEAFERAVEVMANSHVHYTYFDFHHECKNLRFDRVSVLLDGLDLELHQQGYFYQDSTRSPDKPQKLQTSVVRTNCMDCLDRTNVVQSALGKWVLNNQLREAGILAPSETVDEHKDFIHLFRNIWADNADVVSKAYSGTGALKTDYTRTGKRSKEGALQDGVNSVIRYIKNNFLDGPRQDAYDLVTGAWVPKKGEETNWRDPRDVKTRLAPYVLAVAITLLFLAALVPTLVAAHVMSTRTMNILAFVLVAVSFQFITANGISYVSWPRLKKLDEVIHYQGKGYESGRHGRPLRQLKKAVGLDAKRD